MIGEILIASAMISLILLVGAYFTWTMFFDFRNMKIFRLIFEKLKTFLFQFIEYFKKEEIEDLSSVIGIALENNTKNGDIEIRLLNNRNCRVICEVDGEIRKDDLITISESGKVKKYER